MVAEKNVMHVPNLHRNLISTEQLDDEGYNTGLSQDDNGKSQKVPSLLQKERRWVHYTYAACMIMLPFSQHP